MKWIPLAFNVLLMIVIVFLIYQARVLSEQASIFQAEFDAYQQTVTEHMQFHFDRGLASGCMYMAMVGMHLEVDKAEKRCTQLLTHSVERDWFNTMP